MTTLNKDTTICISLSKYPSNIGTRFHNFLYEELDLDFIYKACFTDDLVNAIAGIRALGIRGCSVSMPFKEDVMELVDTIEPSAIAINAVNTIVNNNGHLTASNTDFEAVAHLLKSHSLGKTQSVLVQGAGGMAKAVVAAFHQAGFKNLTITARNKITGQALADRYGYNYSASLPSPGQDILVNVTPMGMTGKHETIKAFTDAHIDAALTIFDVVALPSETPLISAARVAGKHVITGAEVVALQAAAQFKKYTGRSLSEDQIVRASKFSRA